jgi:hypothetical protein
VQLTCKVQPFSYERIIEVQNLYTILHHKNTLKIVQFFPKYYKEWVIDIVNFKIQEGCFPGIK